MLCGDMHMPCSSPHADNNADFAEIMDASTSLHFEVLRKVCKPYGAHESSTEVSPQNWYN